MKEEKITQQWCVLKWWKTHKYITTADGFSKLYILDLQGVIRQLKEKGYDIGNKWVYVKNIYGKSARYKKYWLIKKGV